MMPYEQGNRVRLKKRDWAFMALALRLARRGVGRTSPNPCVGAVLVRGGRIIGRGWHRAAGQPHAEVEAVEDARRNGESVRGSTLYVTLEPCSTWGRTPPCTDLIIRHGIRRVVVGATDPNPKHNGRGLRRLRRAGTAVTTGVMVDACADLNRAWNHWIVTRSPWVIAKCGMTLDGKIATAKGESRWITGEAARREAHRLRSQVDAILVGINTVLRDDPLLTVRLSRGHGRQPWRVVLDRRARTPLRSRILQDGQAERTWIFVGKKASRVRVQGLVDRGARVTRVAEGRDGMVLRAVLRQLGRNEVVSVLVEGGGTVLGDCFDKRLVKEVAFFVAPKILGDRASVKAVAGDGLARWEDSVELGKVKVRKVGEDLMVVGRVEQSRKARKRAGGPLNNS